MADTTQDAGSQGMGFSDGGKFDSSGKALDATALADVNNLNVAAGIKDPATSYDHYISTPATVSSGNASTLTGNNINTYNGIQNGLNGNQNQPYDANTGKTWNQATGDYSGPVSPNYKGGSTSSSGSKDNSGNSTAAIKNVSVATNSDGSQTYTATDTSDPYAVAYAQSQNNSQTYAAQAKLIQGQLDSIRNGTYVLTPAEQSRIDSIQQSIDRQVTAQTQINNTELANLTMSGIRSGRERYTSDSNDTSLADAQSRELQKIRDIQNTGAQLINTAKEAITQNDWKMLNDSLANYQKSFNDQSTSVLNLLKITQDQETSQQNKLKDAIAQQNANTAAFKEQQQFNKDNGVKSQFYQYPGSSQVFDSRTGQPVTLDQYSAAGGKGGDFSDIQIINNSPQLQSAEGKQYQDYLTTLPQGQKAASFQDFTTKHSASYTEWQDYKATGGKLNFNDYMNMDANRKATRVTNNTVTYNQAKDQKTTDAISRYSSRLKQLAGSNDGKVSPQDWQKAYDSWTSEGQSGADFENNFRGFVNFNDPGARNNYSLK